MPNIGRKIELTGVILPSRWDEEGNVIDIKFYAHGEKQYQISEGGKWDKLHKMLKKPVRVSGNLTETKEGQEALFVRKINIIKGEKDEAI